MARPVDPEEYLARRNAILAAAQQLVFTKGYEQMSIQDILDALAISKGAFYHYFDSKADLLEALIERGQDDLDEAFRALVEDPTLSATAKLRQFFSILNQTRRAQKALVFDVMRIWFADDNTIVREKLDGVMAQRRAPWLTAIVRQGIREGVFSASHPDQAGRVILLIVRGMENAVLKLILALEQQRDARPLIDEIVAVSDALAEAVERVLGSPVPILDRLDARQVRAWMTELRRGARRTSAASMAPVRRAKKRAN